MPQISLTVREEEKEEWQKRAEEQDMSFSRWAATRLRAGQKLWDTDNFQRQTLDALVAEETDLQEVHKEEEEELVEIVYRNLSADEPTEFDKLVDLVFQDQQERIAKALKKLQDEGKVENIPPSKYQRTR